MEWNSPLADTAPDGILVLEDRRIAFANPPAADLLGAAGSEQLLGRPLADFLDAESRSSVDDYLLQPPTGPSTPPLDVTALRADGTRRDLAITGRAFVEDGTRRMQLALRDVTSWKRTERTLRESEERLTLAVAGGQVGVWDWDLETNAVIYSARWKEMLGYAGDEIEPNLSAWERLVHPDDRSRADDANESVARGERSTYEAEFRLRHKDGHYVHVLSRGFPVRRTPDGPVVRIVGTHFDLSERKRADAARARAELLSRLVFAQEDERRRIAREMHDRFGEHLTALTVRIRTLKEAAGDNREWRAMVDAVETIAQRLDADVDHLVWELRPTALDDLGLRAALANYVQDWSTRLGVPATLHTSGLMDERLSADTETALYRIAQEALTNIARHARATNVEVILERRTEHVLLIVEDNGVGFDTAARDASRSFGMLGMQERAGLIGATLEIESSPGQGTTVLVRMAARTAPARAGDHA